MAINWRDCLIPDTGMFVWVAYQKKPPYLPYAIANTVGELADILGIDPQTIRYANWAYQKGRVKNARYAKVYVGYEEELYE